MSDAHSLILAEVERELAEMAAIDAEVAARLAKRSSSRRTGTSVVYSFRLDPDEVAALERRAAAAGLKPSVLARNLVRVGLRGRGDVGLSRAVDQLESAVREVRALVA